MSGSGNDDEWFERQDHPLKNNVILGMVFQHLRKRDLKECRVVCKIWNVLTIPFTRKAFEINICGNNSTKTNTIENFVQVFRSNQLGIPFSIFELGPFSTTDGIGQEFLQLCGSTATDIQLDYVRDYFTIEDVSELLRSTQKLEKFSIPQNIRSREGNIVKLFPGPEETKPKLNCLEQLIVLDDNPDERNECCPTFVEELIMAAPNISDLYLSELQSDGWIEISSSLEVLKVIEKLGRESFIHKSFLGYDVKDDSEHLELLRRMTMKPNGLKLKKLFYEPYTISTENHAFQLISLFKDTVECLNVEKTRITNFVGFQTMPKLKWLSIPLSKDFDFRSVNLNRIFPALLKMTLFQNYWNFGEDAFDEVYHEFFPESDPCPNVKSLFLATLPFDINGFNQIRNLFPNLTELAIDLEENGEEILRQIWSQMTQLESLDIDGSLDTKVSLDSIFTGISDHVLQGITDVLKNIEEMTSEGDRREAISDLRTQHSTLPSIGNLTKLRSLTLELSVDEEGRDEWKYLTDLTGYLSFYSIQSLKDLSVEKCELTKTCCEILTKEMGLESLTFKNSQDEDIIPSVSESE